MCKLHWACGLRLQERQSEGEKNMFEIIKTENKVKTDFSFVYSASIMKNIEQQREQNWDCARSLKHIKLLWLSNVCVNVYTVFFFSFSFYFCFTIIFFLFILSVREMFVKVIWQQKLCHCSFIGLHLVRALTHAYGVAFRPMSFFSARAVSVVHTKLLLASKRGV